MLDVYAKIPALIDSHESSFGGEALWARVERVDAPFNAPTQMECEGQGMASVATAAEDGARAEGVRGFVASFFKRAA